jgi:hypothetical protein
MKYVSPTFLTEPTRLLLPGGATDTCMIPDDVPEAVRRQLLRPEVMVEPLLWLASEASADITGTRLNAARRDSTCRRNGLPRPRSRMQAGPTRLRTDRPGDAVRAFARGRSTMDA